MAPALRIAIGRCSCADPQPDTARQAVCREMMQRLRDLKSGPTTRLHQLPAYSEAVQVIEGREVTFETISEPFTDDGTIIVLRAFFRTRRRPTWLSFQGVGHMFADGFVVRRDGTIEDAIDEWMWGYR